VELNGVQVLEPEVVFVGFFPHTIASVLSFLLGQADPELTRCVPPLVCKGVMPGATLSEQNKCNTFGEQRVAIYCATFGELFVHTLLFPFTFSPSSAMEKELICDTPQFSIWRKREPIF
jgi:hypothetical protein